MNEATEHNPDNLTPEQYGAPEWRLLTKSEMEQRDMQSDADLECWSTDRKEWLAGFQGTAAGLTYRRRVPTRQPEESEAKPSVCATCQGHGFIPFTRGQTPESFEQGEYACPDCNPEPTRADLSLIEELRGALEKLNSMIPQFANCDPMRPIIRAALASIGKGAGEQKLWRCFHCDQVFTDEFAARQHFGQLEESPACADEAGKWKEAAFAFSHAVDGVLDTPEVRAAMAKLDEAAKYREQTRNVHVGKYAALARAEAMKGDR